MKFFYLSSMPNPNGKFEIHERDCQLIPDSLDRDYLGPFNNGPEAMRRAQKSNPSVSLCPSCCGNLSHAVFFKQSEN